MTLSIGTHSLLVFINSLTAAPLLNLSSLVNLNLQNSTYQVVMDSPQGLIPNLTKHHFEKLSPTIEVNKFKAKKQFNLK